MKTAELMHFDMARFFASRRGCVILIMLIFALSVIHRLNGLGEYPKPHTTDDEYHYLWVGMSLLETGKPYSWSQLSGERDAIVGQAKVGPNSYYIMRPALDHPPLFSLVAGLFAEMTHPAPANIVSAEGQPHLHVWDYNMGHVRLLMVGIYIITFWFAVGLAWNAGSPGIGVLTALFFGFLSHVVTHGRLVLSDNFTSMLLVGNVFIVERYLAGKIRTSVMGWTTVILVAAAVMSKIPAACGGVGIIAMLVFAGKRKEVMWPLAGLALGLGIYLVYNYCMGWDVFVATMESQGKRFRGFNALQQMSGTPRLLSEYDYNGPIMLAWVCMFLQGLRSKSAVIWAAPWAYMLAFTIFAGDILFGWYSIPFYPYLCMALAATVVQVWENPLRVGFVVLIAWLLPNTFQTLLIAHFELTPILRGVFVLVAAICLLAPMLPRPKAVKVLQGALACMIFLTMTREYYEVKHMRTDRISDAEKYVIKF